MTSPEPRQPPPPGTAETLPPGRFRTNMAFLCVPMTLLGWYIPVGLLGCYLAGTAIAKGDRRLGTYALIAVIAAMVFRLMLRLALGGAPAIPGS